MKRNFVAICLTLTLVACGEPTPATTTQAASSASAPANAITAAVDSFKTAYDAAFLKSFRKNFVERGVDACMRSSGKGEKVRQPCECAMNTLNEGLTDDEVFAISKGKEPEDMEQRMHNAVAACGLKQ